MRLHHLLWLFVFTAPTVLASSSLERAHDSVVKLRAVDAKGATSFGSGVVIGFNRVATTCHVTRAAKAIDVSHGARHWTAEAQIGSIDHDVCVLTVANLDLPALPIRHSAELRLQERVVAIGFPAGGELAIDEGTVEGLYEFEGGQVIRTSARFDFGASGGGLFDTAGNLIGLLAFKSRNADALRFALPAEWLFLGTQVGSSLEVITIAAGAQAFWERAKAAQPGFLRQALVEATSQR